MSIASCRRLLPSPPAVASCHRLMPWRPVCRSGYQPNARRGNLARDAGLLESRDAGLLESRDAGLLETPAYWKCGNGCVAMAVVNAAAPEPIRAAEEGGQPPTSSARSPEPDRLAEANPSADRDDAPSDRQDPPAGSENTPSADAAPGGSGGGDTGRTCQICGRTGSGPDLLQWVMDRRAGRVSWTCPACAATHLRSLEAKLEPEWW